MRPLATKERPIAPAWHTLALLALLAVSAWWGVYLRMASADARLHHLPLYTRLIVGEWVVFAFTLWGSDRAFVAFVGRVVRQPGALGRDILTAVVLAAALLLTAPVVARILGPAGFVSTRGLLPTDGAEVAVWMITAISAGIVEETVFRGYLQQQITAWTGSATVGIIAQAIMFGAGHAYQGWKNVTLICVWGVGFGVTAWLRRGLRGNMIAHAAIDALAVLSRAG